MNTGIYNVKFTSAQQNSSEGLAVLKDGSINGGDKGYLYLGFFKVDGSTIEAKIRVKRWKPGIASIFGNLEEYDLNLRGTSNAASDNFTVSGSIIQVPTLKITIHGQRISDAA